MQASEEVLKDEDLQPGTVEDEVCQYLIESGRLKSVDLKRAETFREQNGGDLITLLVRLGLVSERDVAEAEANLLDLELISTADLPEDPPDIGNVSLRYLKQHLLLPVAVTDTDMIVVMANPRDQAALKALSMASRKTIVRQVGVASEIEMGWKNSLVVVAVPWVRL